MRSLEVAKPVLRPVEMRLIRVAVPARAGVGRHVYVREFRFALFDRLSLVVRIDENVEKDRKVLALERQHVVDVRIHLVIGIGDRLLPQLFPFGRQRLRLSFVLMGRGINLQQKAKEMDHAAGIFVPEAAGFAIGAARIEWENRFQMRRVELRSHELLGAEAGNADHADIAVAPRLRRDPFDEVIAVEGARAAALRFADAARIADHVHVAARDEKARVTGLGRAGPQHRPRGMRQRSLSGFRPLQVLVVDREGEQRR